MALRSRRMSLIAVAATLVGLLLLNLINARSAGSFGITVLSGLFQGMLLFLVASGLSLVFGLLNVLNFAQGALFMVGAYVAYDAQHPGGLIDLSATLPDPNLRFPVAVILALVTGGLLGLVLERGLLQPLYARPAYQLVLTFGVALLLNEAVRLVWTTTPFSWTDQFGIRENFFVLFGQRFSTYRLFVVGVGGLLIVVIALLLRRTRIGIIIRAGVEDSEMVQALGIDVRSVFTLVFVLGSAVAALGGAVAAPFLGASPSLGNTFLIQALAVVILGGLGSYEGTAVASVMVGLAIATAQETALGTSLALLPSLSPMLLLIAVLLLRPRGLFGGTR